MHLPVMTLSTLWSIGKPTMLKVLKSRVGLSKNKWMTYWVKQPDSLHHAMGFPTNQTWHLWDMQFGRAKLGTTSSIQHLTWSPTPNNWNVWGTCVQGTPAGNQVEKLWPARSSQTQSCTLWLGTRCWQWDVESRCNAPRSISSSNWSHEDNMWMHVMYDSKMQLLCCPTVMFCVLWLPRGRLL